MLTSTTTGLLTIQALMYSTHGWGLHTMARCLRRTPDGFSAEMRAQHRALLTRSIAERWVLQQMLPTEAANDSRHAPSAA